MVRSLDCLIEMQLAVGEGQSAVETAVRAVDLDPYRERTYQGLMRAYAATGNRAEAVSEPSKETEAIYLNLLESVSKAQPAGMAVAFG